MLGLRRVEWIEFVCFDVFVGGSAFLAGSAVLSILASKHSEEEEPVTQFLMVLSV